EATELPPPKALIVPHAGYIYSGLTAAFVYALLEPIRAQIRRVALLGPAHYVAFSGVALSPAEAFMTPMGRVPLDRALESSLLALPQVLESAQAHAPEHSLEVQLPFLQRVLDDFTLVPLVIGNASTHEVAAVIEACWGGPETLVLISSDLSHYLPYATAQAMDADTVRRILDLNWPLLEQTACGARGVNAMMVAATSHQLRPTLIDFRNSGDTGGDRDRVVGYASIAFTNGVSALRAAADNDEAG
ncbi:MAG TPA: AmmeMemoRadiSam system protein B, partial [Propionibacteriaceae bacterium]|nr:AmmeMemoRadiSam system protein B [Propionibacteriaceae bacterium]